MADEHSADNTENTTPPVPVTFTSTRREFLGRAGEVAAAAVGVIATLGPTAVLAGPVIPDSHKNIEQGENTHSEFNWKEIYQLIDRLPRPDQASALVLESIRAQVKIMEYAYGPRIDRVNELIALTDLDHPTPDSLADNLRKSMGALAEDREILEDCLPFYREKKSMLSVYGLILGDLTDLSSRSDETIGVLAAYYYLNYNISGILAEQFREFGYEKQTEFSGQTIISIAPGIQVRPDSYALFDADQRRIGSFLDKLPFLKKFAQVIRLRSTRYGFSKQPDLGREQSGTFRSERHVWLNKHLGIIDVDMDHGLGYHYWPEFTFAHESGHATSVFLNPDFAEGLTPEELIERMNYELQIFNNRDWSDHGWSLPQLFRKGPSLRGDTALVNGPGKIDTPKFVDLITEYPENVVLLNHGPSTGFPAAIVDELTFDKPYSTFTQPGTRIDGQERFNDLDSFLKVYLPKVRQDAALGNVRSQIILWAIDNFKEEIKSYDRVWSYYKTPNGFHFVPTPEDKTASTWSNYFNVVVSNGAVFHAVMNGLPEVKRWFYSPEQRIIERRVKFLREVYRNELFADGIGWSYLFGDRMAEKPPFRGALEHAAALVDRRKAA